jgi:hypothetical protein
VDCTRGLVKEKGVGQRPTNVLLVTCPSKPAAQFERRLRPTGGAGKLPLLVGCWVSTRMTSYHVAAFLGALKLCWQGMKAALPVYVTASRARELGNAAAQVFNACTLAAYTLRAELAARTGRAQPAVMIFWDLKPRGRAAAAVGREAPEQAPARARAYSTLPIRRRAGGAGAGAVADQVHLRRSGAGARLEPAARRPLALRPWPLRPLRPSLSPPLARPPPTPRPPPSPKWPKRPRPMRRSSRRRWPRPCTAAPDRYPSGPRRCRTRCWRGRVRCTRTSSAPCPRQRRRQRRMRSTWSRRSASSRLTARRRRRARSRRRQARPWQRVAAGPSGSGSGAPSPRFAGPTLGAGLAAEESRIM